MNIINHSNIRVISSQYMTLLIVTLISILSFTIFFNTWLSIVDIWIRSETFTHGFIIAPISFWLIWTKRTTIKNLNPEPAWIAIIFVTLNGMLWLMADMIDALVFKQFAAVGLLITTIWFYLGNKITVKILFPLFFLYFMVPVGEVLFPYLMNFTANFTVKLLRLTGVSVYQEGLYFTLTTGNWSVIEQCSGLRYLIASVTLGLVYAYTNYTKLYKRLTFSLASIIVPIIANGCRAYMIVMIGHLSNMKLAVGIDHVIYGAIFFGVVMIILFYIGSLWKDNTLSEVLSEEEPKNISMPLECHSIGIVRITSILATISILLTIWPVSSNWLKMRYQSNLGLNTITNVNLQEPWRYIDKQNWPWKPKLQGVKTESMDYLNNGTNTVAIYQANFGNESQDAELVNSNNSLTRVVYGNWALSNIKKIYIKRQNSPSIIIEESIIKGVKDYILILNWYQIGNKCTANPYMAKFYQLIKRIKLDNSPEILVMLMTTYNSNQESIARSTLLSASSIILK